MSDLIKKICSIADSKNSAIDVCDKKVRDAKNPLDQLDVRTRDISRKEKPRNRQRLMILDNEAVDDFITSPRSERRKLISQLDARSRRKFLRQIRDAKERKDVDVDLKKEDTYEFDLELFGVVLSDAVNSQSDKDFDMLRKFIEEKNITSEPCIELANKVLDDTVDLDEDEDLIAEVEELTGYGEILSSFQTVYGVDEDLDSEIDIQFDGEDEDEDVKEDVEITDSVSEDEVSEVEDETLESDEISEDEVSEVEDSANQLDYDVISVMTLGSLKRGNSLSETFTSIYDSVKNHDNSIDFKDVALSILKVIDSAKINDNFAEKISEGLEEAINNEVGEVSLISILNEALEDFANGDSEKLNEFVTANTISEVGELLSEDNNGISEGEDIVKEDVEVSDKEPSEDEEVVTTEENEDGEEITLEEFNPKRKEDCVRLAKMVLSNKLTKKVSDALSKTFTALKDNALYTDNTELGRDVQGDINTIVVPMSPSEYAQTQISTEIPSMVSIDSQFSCPPLCEEPTADDCIIILNPSTRPISVVPIDMEVGELMDSIKDMSLEDKRAELSKKAVLVSDCVKFASKHNRLNFIDNRFYKRNITDSFWSIEGSPKCLGELKGSKLYPSWCKVSDNFTEVDLFGTKYKLV